MPRAQPSPGCCKRRSTACMPKALWPAGAAQHAKATVASVATAPLTTPGHAAHDHMPAHEPRLVSCQFKGHARPPHARTRVRHALTGRAPVCAEMRAAARCGAAGCSADSPASASASGAATAASAARAPLAGGPRAALSPRAAAGLGLVVGLRAPAACAGAGRTGDTRRTRRAPARFPVSDPALARWSQVGAAGAGSAQGAPLPAAVAAAAAAWFCLPPLRRDRGAGKAAWRHAADRLARAVRDVRGPRLHRGPSPWLASCAQGTGRLLERLLQRRRTGPRGCGPRRRGSFHACFCCAGRRGGGRSRRRRLCVAAAGPSAAHGTGICLGACRRWRRRGKGRWLDHGPAGCERGSGVIVSARQLRGRHPAPIRSLQLAAAGCSAAELSGVRACTSGRGGGDSIGRLPGTGAARQATVQPAGDCVFAGSRRRCGCPGSRRRRAAARWRGALRCADVRAEACSVPAGFCGHRSGRVVAGIGAARLAGAGGQRARGRRRGCQRADERHGARVGARGAALAHCRARQRPAGDGRRGVDQVRPSARQVGVRGEAGRRLRRRAP